MGICTIRTMSATAALLMLSAGAAGASSFVTLPAHGSKPAPSIVTIGAPLAAARSQASPSIVALGTPAPSAVPAATAVAAVPNPRPSIDLPDASIQTAALPADEDRPVVSPQQSEPFVTPGWIADQMALERPAAPPPHIRRHARFSPMVIRGGLKGEAFSREVQNTATRAVSADNPERSKLPEAPPPMTPGVTGPRPRTLEMR